MLWIFLEHFGNEILCCLADGDCVWEWVIALFYFAVGSFDIVGFERRPTNQEGVGDYSHAPDIDFVRMTVVVMICI